MPGRVETCEVRTEIAGILLYHYDTAASASERRYLGVAGRSCLSGQALLHWAIRAAGGKGSRKGNSAVLSTCGDTCSVLCHDSDSALMCWVCIL